MINCFFLFSEIETYLKHILSNVDVCSKRFLTTKVDRSVTGLVAQQQCVGSLQIPISNYSSNAFSYFDNIGSVSATGERPLLGIYSSNLQAEYTLAEMLTNMVGGYIEDVKNIKSSVNWMWPNNHKNEARKLYDTAAHLTEVMKKVGVGIDGGKDSLSMMVKTPSQNVKSPGNVVITVMHHNT